MPMLKRAHPEYIEEMKRRTSKLPLTLSSASLKEEQLYLSQYPWLFRNYLLEKQNGNDTTSQEKEKINDLNDKILHFKSSDYSKLLSLNIDRENFQVTVYKPENGSGPKLLKKIKSIGEICWNDKSKEEIDIITGRLHKDAELGGNVMLFVEKDNKPVVFVRNYVTVDTEGRPLLFQDTIESGEQSWNSFDEWNGSKRKYDLYLSLLASVNVTRRLGFNEIAMTEQEARDFSVDLGASKRTLFNVEEKAKRKVGLLADKEEGVYYYNLWDDPDYKVLQLDMGVSEKELISKIKQQGSDFLNVINSVKVENHENGFRRFFRLTNGRKIDSSEKAKRIYPLIQSYRSLFSRMNSLGLTTTDTAELTRYFEEIDKNAEVYFKKTHIFPRFDIRI